MTFTCNLMDGVDPGTSKAIRIVGEAQDTIHALIPTGEPEPAFEWVSFHRRLLPTEALAKLDDKMEQLAVIMEDGRLS